MLIKQIEAKYATIQNVNPIIELYENRPRVWTSTESLLKNVTIDFVNYSVIKVKGEKIMFDNTFGKKEYEKEILKKVNKNDIKKGCVTFLDFILFNKREYVKGLYELNYTLPFEGYFNNWKIEIIE